MEAVEMVPEQTQNGALAEPAPPNPAEKQPPPGDYSKNFAALTRKEQAIQRQMQQFKTEKAAWDAERAKIAADKPAPIRPKSPLELLEGDLTPQQLAQATKEELQAFRREQEEAKKADVLAQQEAAQAAAQETIEAFKADISDFVKAKPDDYELIALNNSYDLVYAVVEEHFETKKAILTIKEAADLVEAHLERELKAMLGKSKKLSAAAKPAETPATPVEPKAPAPNRTLNNGMTSKTPTLLVNNAIQEDAFQRALKALGG